MFGNNPILKPEQHSGDYLKIQEIFATLQGEGPFAGRPAVFIRLGGCNLACDFCDTEFDSFKEIALTEIIETAKKLAINHQPQHRLAVITGGEPMRQPIFLLCNQLIANGFNVQIETNGTLFQELPEEVKIICSPKNINGTYFHIRPDLLKKIDAFKFLISASNPNYQNLPDFIAEVKVPIYLQPIDEYQPSKNLANQQLATKICLENGYFLSLQIHKILNIS